MGGRRDQDWDVVGVLAGRLNGQRAAHHKAGRLRDTVWRLRCSGSYCWPGARQHGDDHRGENDHDTSQGSPQPFDLVDVSRPRSAWAIAGVGPLDAIAATVGHVEVRDRQDGGHVAIVDGVLLVFGMLEEDLPGGVGVDAALAAADRLAVEGELTGLDDQHYYAWVRVPARKTAGRYRVLRGDDVVALSLLDPEGVIGLSAPDQHGGKPGPGVRACHRDRARHEPGGHEPHQRRFLTEHRCLPCDSGVSVPHGRFAQWRGPSRRWHSGSTWAHE